eukprot:3569074-Rhodomonas_salina.1
MSARAVGEDRARHAGVVLPDRAPPNVRTRLRHRQEKLSKWRNLQSKRLGPTRFASMAPSSEGAVRQKRHARVVPGSASTATRAATCSRRNQTQKCKWGIVKPRSIRQCDRGRKFCESQA